MDSMKKTFRPEFLNRVDEIIIFQQLTDSEIREIVDLMSSELQKRVEVQEMSLVVEDSAKDVIAKEGYQPEYGARPLRRAIQTLLEDSLAEEMLRGEYKAGDVITAYAEESKIKFRKSGKVESKDGDNGSSSESDKESSKSASAKAEESKQKS